MCAQCAGNLSRGNSVGQRLSVDNVGQVNMFGEMKLIRSKDIVHSVTGTTIKTPRPSFTEMCHLEDQGLCNRLHVQARGCPQGSGAVMRSEKLPPAKRSHSVQLSQHMRRWHNTQQATASTVGKVNHAAGAALGGWQQLKHTNPKLPRETVKMAFPTYSKLIKANQPA